MENDPQNNKLPTISELYSDKEMIAKQVNKIVCNNSITFMVFSLKILILVNFLDTLIYLSNETCNRKGIDYHEYLIGYTFFQNI